ncbi:DUF4433 domain-containing protein [Geminocystis sp. GBBB08]|uniref:type II toxin-antitoxin system toxin DNA ADP-ribosyl transferase DarT n=1 Tax=Geminocystis sp. GBBB08 TaxID=2604140 RepID=UPI0027E2D231|nr:DUF4433 domain-containing protein [Geminocystis sp. GBBB08]MBL1209861.1 DUF4433 domain-containing protein [Geminocystis sp. GBBB08]
MPTEIYHITHIKNLSSIIKSGELTANSLLKRQNQTYQNIAHQNLQYRRAITSVTCGQKGTLHDYVPFYFAPRSPMLYAINQKQVQGYTQGQKPIIYLVTTAETIKNASIPFVFTDGHGIMAYSEFYDDLKDLNTVIDWDVMNSKMWTDTAQFPDRKRRRQAEFLVYQYCPWQLINSIAVIDSSIAQQVNQLLQTHSHQIPVNICRNWYY